MRSLLLALSLLCVAAPVWAQKSEPVPPGSEGDDNERPPSRPRPRTAANGASIAPTDTETGPAAAKAPSDGKKFDPLDWKHAIGAYARYMFVTELMLRPYTDTSTALNSFAVGLQYIHRFEKFDVVTSLDFSWMNMNDGNWLGKGNDPAFDTKYVQFDKLSFLSADVAIIGHHAFNNWLELRGGAGLGLGVVFGNVYTPATRTRSATRTTSATPRSATRSRPPSARSCSTSPTPRPSSRPPKTRRGSTPRRTPTAPRATCRRSWPS
jgi:hypothetical protein